MSSPSTDSRPSCLQIPPRDASVWAEQLSVSLEAIELFGSLEVFDLQVDSFTPARMFRYNLFEDHGDGTLLPSGFGHADFPRGLEAGLAGVAWSMTTNPMRGQDGQWTTLLRNLELVQQVIDGTGGALRIVSDHASWVATRRAGGQAALLTIRGASPLLGAPGGVGDLPQELISRVALVHVFGGQLGASASRLGIRQRHRGLPAQGRALIEALNAHRIQVDLAGLADADLLDALEIHAPDLPAMISHTGAREVRPSRGSCTDEMARRVAETGGLVGVSLTRGSLGDGGPDAAVDHLEHLIGVCGDEHVGVGSHYDGGGAPTVGLEDWLTWPRLVDVMLRRGWQHDRVARVLGVNALRVLESLRPGDMDAIPDLSPEVQTQPEEPPAPQPSPSLPEANERRREDRRRLAQRRTNQPRAPRAPVSEPDPAPPSPASSPEPSPPRASRETLPDRRGFFRLGRQQLQQTTLHTARALVGAVSEYNAQVRGEGEDEGFHRDRVRSAAGVEGQRTVIRPPGAIEEEAFLRTCERCRACAEACPEASIVAAGPQMGRRIEMTPILIPDQQPCFLCEDVPCAQACPSGALLPIPAAQIQIAAVQALPEQCLNTRGESCDLCVEVCPRPNEAIGLGSGGVPLISLDACTGCGQCVYACPAHPKALIAHPR